MKKYASCRVDIGLYCSKHGVVHKIKTIKLKAKDVIHRGCGGEVKIKSTTSQLLAYMDWRCQKCKAEAHTSRWRLPP